MPSSSGRTAGPHSLISVYVPPVGSTTAVEVRDSPSMCTKSLRIASCVSSSTIRDPVAPPTSPVATTGTPSSLSARATLMPLPPASVTPALARCRCPRWKFGTVSVRSTAALRVTVTIIASEQVAQVVQRPVRVPAYSARQTRFVNRARSDEIAARAQRSALPHLDTTENVTRVHRQRRARIRDHLLRQRVAEPRDEVVRLRRDERDRLLAVRQLDACVGACTLDRRHDAELRKPPDEQRLEVGVARRARGAPEDRRVHRDAVPARGGDLAPARQ